VQLARVEFLLDDRHAEQARPILESLHILNPRHPGILRYLALAYQQLGPLGAVAATCCRNC
jgi:uncharacterized protein HemY